MSEVQARQPIINAPGIVIGLLGLLAAVHGGRQLLGPELDDQVIVALALIPARSQLLGLQPMGAGLPGGEIAVWTQFVTHMLLHADLAHLLINGAWLLVFGSIVARRLGTLRFLAFFVATGIAAGLAFYLVHRSELQPMVGASGAVSGLMAGALILMFSASDAGAGGLVSRYARLVPRLSLRRLLVDRRMIAATLALVGLNLLLATSFGAFLTGGGGIAWEAHLGGYFAGLLGFGLIDAGPKRGDPPVDRTPVDGSTPEA